MNTSFWHQKKVLITGHTGFKGSWLSFWLQSLGAKVIGYALPPPTDPSLFKLIHLENNIQSYEGDIRDFNYLHQLISQEQPEIVFHLAAQSLVRESYQQPVETYATNVMGTVNLLEALRKAACTRVAIVVTSDKCYENREWWWGYREADAIGGHDPYSSSKACAELVTAAYRHSFFAENPSNPLFLASVRAGNVIGGGDFAKDRLIPDFFRAIDQKIPLKVRYPNAIRPWQHVLEPLRGYLMLAERLWHDGSLYADSWNFGPSDQDAKSVSWIANFLTTYCEESTSWECDHHEQHAHEAHYLKLDASKAYLKLNWQPRLSLSHALNLTLDWYHAYRKKHDLNNMMHEQIANYPIS